MLEEARPLFERPLGKQEVSSAKREEKEVPKVLAGVPRDLIEQIRTREREKMVKQCMDIHQPAIIYIHRM